MASNASVSYFFRLSAINILSSITIPIAGLVDTAFLGHLEDINYIAGTSIASVIFSFIFGACIFLRMGTTGPVAQAEAGNDQTETLLILLRSSTIALVLGLLLLIFQTPIQKVGFALLPTLQDVKTVGQDYFSARISGAPAVLLNYCLIGWFLGRGKSFIVLTLLLISCLSNIGFDYLFIIQFHWKSAGVGAATAISQYLMFVAGFLYILFEGLLPKFKAIWSQTLHREKLVTMLQLNGDITLRILATRLTLIIFMDLSAALSVEITTINSLLFQVVVFSSLVSEGLSYATETLAGNFKGQNSIDQLPWLLRLSGVASIVLGLVAISPFLLFSDSSFGLLTNHHEIFDEMKIYLVWLAPFTISNSLFNSLRGYWLGLSESKVLRNSTIVGSFLGFTPLAFIAMQFHSNHILWFALCMFLSVSIFVMSHKLEETVKYESS